MNPPLNILAPGPWDAFVPYSGLHAAAFAVCALLIAAPSLIGRTLSESAELHLRRALAAFAVCYWLTYNIWWNWHGLDPRTGLPLQICDVNGLLAPLALLTRWRWAQATLYFWTAALTLQAFVQPALRAGPASPIFWAFWIAHTIIFASAVYDIVVLGFRPTWRDLGRAIIASAVYVAVAMPIDVGLGANYGFLGNPADPSEVPPFIDALGPWPLRAIIVIALAPLGFVIVLLPWRICSPAGAIANGRNQAIGATRAGLAGGDEFADSVAHYNWATVEPSPGESPGNDLEVAMAKGQMRGNKEKKKPKQDKNKKNAPAAPSPFAGMHSQAKPGTYPYGKKS